MKWDMYKFSICFILHVRSWLANCSVEEHYWSTNRVLQSWLSNFDWLLPMAFIKYKLGIKPFNLNVSWNLNILFDVCKLKVLDIFNESRRTRSPIWLGPQSAHRNDKLMGHRITRLCLSDIISDQLINLSLFNAWKKYELGSNECAFFMK